MFAGAHVCVIAFSTIDRVSLDSVNHWNKRIEAFCGTIPTILVQGKIDLLSHASFTRDEANLLSARLQLPLFLTSSKENINIDNG